MFRMTCVSRIDLLRTWLVTAVLAALCLGHVADAEASASVSPSTSNSAVGDPHSHLVLDDDEGTGLRSNQRALAAGRPPTFWEYYQQHRAAVLEVTPMLSFAPRSALVLMAFTGELPPGALPEDDPIALTWETALIPEYYLWKHSDSLLGGPPAYLNALALLKCMVTAFAFVVALCGLGSSTPGEIACNELQSKLIATALTWVYTAVFPVLPWQLCTFVFLVTTYVLPLIQLLLALADTFGLIPHWVTWCAAESPTSDRARAARAGDHAHDVHELGSSGFLLAASQAESMC